MSANQADTRAKLLAEYGQGYEKLSAVLTEYPGEMWRFRPSKTAWSLHEIVVHMLDSEVHDFVRMRTAVADPGATVMAYNEAAWTRELDYHRLSLTETLKVFHLLRKILHTWLLSLAEEQWQRTVIHSERGSLTLEQILEGRIAHMDSHLNQIQENFNVWQASQKNTKG